KLGRNERGHDASTGLERAARLAGTVDDGARRLLPLAAVAEGEGGSKPWVRRAVDPETVAGCRHHAHLRRNGGASGPCQDAARTAMPRRRMAPDSASTSSGAVAMRRARAGNARRTAAASQPSSTPVVWPVRSTKA